MNGISKERVTNLRCDDVKLELFPVIVGLFECLHLSIRDQNHKFAGPDQHCNAESTYIGLGPRPHTLTQSLETHLKCRHLVRFAEIGLKPHCNVLPWQVLFFFEFQEELFFFVKFHGSRLRWRSLSLLVSVVRVFFLVTHAFQSVHLSKTNWVGRNRHWSMSAVRRVARVRSRIFWRVVWTRCFCRWDRLWGHGKHGWRIVIVLHAQWIFGKQKILNVWSECARAALRP